MLAALQDRRSVKVRTHSIRPRFKGSAADGLQLYAVHAACREHACLQPVAVMLVPFADNWAGMSFGPGTLDIQKSIVISAPMLCSAGSFSRFQEHNSP